MNQPRAPNPQNFKINDSLLEKNPVYADVANDTSYDNSGNISPKGKKSKWWRLVGLLILFIGLVVGYFFYMPSSIATRVMAYRLEKLNTLSYSGEANAEITTGSSIPLLSQLSPNFQRAVLGVNSADPNDEFSGSLSLKFNGKVDVKDLDKPKFMFGLETVKLTYNGKTTELFSGETRLIDKILYLKINNVTEEFFDDSKVKNNWYKIDTKEYVGQTEEEKLSEEDQKKARQLYRKYPFLETQKINDEKFGKTWHYQYTIDNDKMIDYLVEIAKIQNKK